MIYLRNVAVLFTLLIVVSCQKEEVLQKQPKEYDAQVLSSWTATTLSIVKETPGFTPPVAARTFGYMGLAMYQAVQPGIANSKSLAGQINGFDPSSLPVTKVDQVYQWDLVANAAIYHILQACFNGAKIENAEKLKSQFDQLNTALSKDISNQQIEASIEYGTQIGQAVAEFAITDGQVECYKSNFPASYTVPKGKGFWVPTSGQAIPLQPYWGKVRTFGKNSQNVIIEAPISYSEDKSSEFYKEAVEVYEIVKNLSTRERVIAEYWSDDPVLTATPPGHSMSIAMQVINKEKVDLAKAAEIYAKVGMGLHDAFVSCWKSKYEYNLLRPVSYIRSQIDGQFTTPLNTPPFPEYTSGHSVQSGATAEILESFFGKNFTFTDRTHVDRKDINGAPRTFFSFSQFAEEAALSRLYGGIHYRKGIDEGVKQGRLVGKEVLKLEFK